MADVLAWNVDAQKFFETGLDKGVLYVRAADGTYPLGVAWEGLISVAEKPGGGEATDLYANNTKYASLISAETFEGTIEAYMFPNEWLVCDGVQEIAADAGVYAAQQARSSFGLAYRNWIGSDVEGQQAYYKLHLIYGCRVSPSEASRSTVNESPQAATFSWDFKSTPTNLTGFQPTSHLVIDSRYVDPTALAAIEDELYGDDVGPVTPNLPSPDEILALL